MKDSLHAYVKRSPLHGILLLLLLVFMGASVFSFIGFSIAELILGVPLLTDPSLLDDMTEPSMLPVLRMMQVLQALGMLIIPASIYLWVSSSWHEMETLFGRPNRQSVMLSMVFFMVAFPFVNYVANWNTNVEIPTIIGEWMQGKETNASELTQLFLDMPNWGLLVFNLVMIAVLPAIGEELIFRGVVQRGLQKQFGNPHVAIWLAAALFSAIHLQFFGFVPRLLMGVSMGYLLFWSGNLWYPIIAHFTNNAVSVILAFGIQHGHIKPEIENAGLQNATVASFSLIFCLVLLYLFKQYEWSNSTTR